MSACNKKPSKPEPKLVLKSEITNEIKESLKATGLNTENEIDILFSSDKYSKDAVFVTKKLIAGHKEGEIYGCDLTKIYDIAHSHSYDTINESSITIYLKDNSEFKVQFPGSKEFDEVFFKSLKTNWREAIAKAQKDIEK